MVFRHSRPPCLEPKCDTMRENQNPKQFALLRTSVDKIYLKPITETSDLGGRVVVASKIDYTNPHGNKVSVFRAPDMYLRVHTAYSANHLLTLIEYEWTIQRICATHPFDLHCGWVSAAAVPDLQRVCAVEGLGSRWSWPEWLKGSKKSKGHK